MKVSKPLEEQGVFLSSRNSKKYAELSIKEKLMLCYSRHILLSKQNDNDKKK